MKILKTKIDGVLVSWREIGKGKPILFVHGVGGVGAWAFEPVMSYLSSKYDSVSIDLPGMAGTQPMDNPSVENFRELILKFTEILKWKSFVLVGSSYGGLIALNFAYKNPDKVDRLVLHSVPWNWQYLAPSIKLLNQNFLFSLVKNDLIWRLILGFVWLRYRFLPDRDVSKLSTKIRKRLARGILVSDKNTLMKIMREILRVNMHELVKGIKTPTLIVEGDSSGLVRAESSRKLAEIMPNAKLVVFRDCGHDLPMEKPIEFAGAIKQFIK